MRIKGKENHGEGEVETETQWKRKIKNQLWERQYVFYFPSQKTHHIKGTWVSCCEFLTGDFSDINLRKL